MRPSVAILAAAMMGALPLPTAAGANPAAIPREQDRHSSYMRVFGVTQPRVSDLIRGKIELFSVDSLIAMLGHAGAKVELRVRAA